MVALSAVDPELVDRVKQMPQGEFDALIEQVLALRGKLPATALSPKETGLLKRINLGLSAEFRKRYAQLARRRDKRTLTPAERDELIRMTEEAETRDADRAAALAQLAKSRHVPVRTLMKQLGIAPQAIHG